MNTVQTQRIAIVLLSVALLGALTMAGMTTLAKPAPSPSSAQLQVAQGAELSAQQTVVAPGQRANAAPDSPTSDSESMNALGNLAPGS